MELNGTIFLQMLIFLTALLWLSRYLFLPLISLFEERDRRIEGAKQESEKLNAMALEKERVFDQEFEKARDKARELLAHIKQATEKEHGLRLEKVKADAFLKIRAAEEDLKKQSEEIRPVLEKEVSVLALDIVHGFMGHKA